MIKDFVTLDYESEAIDRRPRYPPAPGGVAIKYSFEKTGRYFAWGHDSGNNCTWGDAHLAIERAWESGLPIVGQHMKFDYEISETKMLMPRLPWDRIHDTEYLLFLHDPHARSLSLKPSAERILGIRPTERDALRDWLVEHKWVTKAQKEWGAHIMRAPGALVGKYALDGDVGSTEKLFKHLMKDISKRKMVGAYDRERRLMPVLLNAERAGIRVDLPALERDVPRFTAARERVANWLRKELKAPDLNLDAKADVGEALFETGIVTDWTWTKGGLERAPQRSVSKKSMTLDKFNDPQIAQAWGYYVRMGTVLNMFLRDWLEIARETGGLILPNWNQVRQMRGRDSFVGTRTGRPSCDEPNLFNVAKNFENNKGDGYYHPKFFKDLPKLPLCRKYLLPDEHCLWLHRDYNQQELRMLAHFEDGELCEHYKREPRFDIHTIMEKGIEEMTGLALGRDKTKIVDFSSIYGKGLTGLALDLKIDKATAARIMAAKAVLMPGVDDPVNGLAAHVKYLGKTGSPIRTWGGREYYAEKPMFSKKFNRMMDFYYKLLNYLVQGSSADVTKEAIIRHDEHPKREGRFLNAVYDEINISTPSLKGLSEKAKNDCVRREMLALRESMESVEVDVPMLSDGKVGSNWAAVALYDKPEQPLERNSCRQSHV